MKLYELMTFTVRVRTVTSAMACLEPRLAQAGGTLMGCWASEIGPLNQITVLRAGRVVEQGEALSVLRAPRMPYTRSLVQASGL